VLAVQGVLTWVPFAVFGRGWEYGIGGLLAGLVLLMVKGRVSWLLAGLLLAAEVVVRAAVTGLPAAPAWFGVLNVVTFYVDDALVVFGLVRLAQILDEVAEGRRRAAGVAVARERLQAARSLQAAVGERIAEVAANAAAARQALSRDAARARAELAAAGVTAREAVARARAFTAGDDELPRQELAGHADPAIGARAAWTVLVATLLSSTAVNLGVVVISRYGSRLLALAVGDIVLTVALQLYHSGAARKGRRPRWWPVTLGLQAVLVYAFLFPFVNAYVGALGVFLAGSVLLLVPGRWRWALYAAVVASYSVLYTVLSVQGWTVPASQRIPTLVYLAAVTAGVGLMVYGLSRLAGLARQLEALRGELAQMAAVRERLRVTRDVHDLLGLGLAAAALKADLIGALIGRDDARAAAEIAEMSRVCAAARADIRLVTGDGGRLSLAAELAAAKQILASAGIRVRSEVPASLLPAAADEVLAPVLREAVTNILRHAAATATVIEVAARDGVLQLHVGNDGVTQQPATGRPADGEGRGLANLNARVRAAGGRLASRQAGNRFDLAAQIPLGGTGPAQRRLGGLRRALLPAWAPGSRAGHR
jgi:two-component system sensor histidine kinase DesK